MLGNKGVSRIAKCVIFHVVYTYITSWDTILLFSKARTFSKMAKRLNEKIINKICAG